MNYFQNQKGLTLIETMAAIILILLLVTAFSGSFIISMETEVDMDERLEATRIIDSLIEHLRNHRDDFENDWGNIENRAEDFDAVGSIAIENGNAEDADIIIEYDFDNENLYRFKFNWQNRNYQKEVFIAGE